MVTVSTDKIARSIRVVVLIIAVVATATAVWLFVLGAHWPTIAMNVGLCTWTIFVALTVGRDLTRAVNAIDASRDFSQALKGLVDTGSMARPTHLRKIN